ncbi:glycosyltransferase family 4 protein [Pseudomonas veronii]|uniref:glycosyltransferase family 4 protein n=1 Tax=Pseudomonas veronii TaxID=76761 RepID=UPI00123291D0|nr:glycosyltransferase family 4 protein [Pseudomonas veronii]KAA6174897.1 glycosyltransferase family 4 protein [Pseudomonas veronii]
MAVRILLLTQWFEPEPTFKGLVFARALVEQGFEVEVVTGFPNYPGGKIYPGYKIKLYQKEVIDGVRVTRLPLYPNHSQSGVGRVLNYLSFGAASLFYGLFGAKRPDVIYAYHPPLTVGIVACLIRFFRRVPVIYDIQDMWPDTLRATGMFSNPKALQIVSRVCQWVYKHVDQIVVLSPGFKRLLVERGVPDTKIDIIYNWCAEDTLDDGLSILPPNFPDKPKFRILFAGTMGKAQALDTVLDAARILSAANTEIVFVFLGGGIEVARLKQRAADDGLDNVVFLPVVPMSEAGRYLRAADALLVHLKRDPLFTITIPSKTQAYLAAGKPILMAVDGDAAELVQRSGSGYIAESQNSQALADAALALSLASPIELDIMAKNGQDFYHSHMSLKKGIEGFTRIFNRFSK